MRTISLCLSVWFLASCVTAFFMTVLISRAKRATVASREVGDVPAVDHVDDHVRGAIG